ncbi:MAG TPA: hypothetical protein PK246_03025 [Saprospiraceae bacterium]|nr:hypothetical protein [Lewinellaceae bacterium]HPK09282.1 hypothetical protein [Saprospiraceae bacterium]
MTMKYQGFKVSVYLIVTMAVISGCNQFDNYSDPQFEKQSFDLSLPIINSKININEVAEKDQTSTLRIEPDGSITAIYSNELIRDNASSLFPPLPIPQEFPILEKDFLVNVPFPSKYDIKRGDFINTEMQFRYSCDYVGKVFINIQSPSIVDAQGQEFDQNYILNSTGGNLVTSSPFNLDGYSLYPIDTSIHFIYNAHDDTGQELDLSRLYMKTDYIEFKYVEGYFGKHRFPINGDFITIGLFTNWISGGIYFEEPRIHVGVDNGFGFPVRSEVSVLDIHASNGDVTSVQSQYIDEGINFDYPSLEEAGQFKRTDFYFNSGNSNVGVLLNDRPVRVVYDMSALANPDDIYNPAEFIDKNSYFSVDIGVELPLYLKVNDLVLADTFDFDFTSYDYIKSATFKLLVNNEFPVETEIQTYFLDENDKILDSLAIDPIQIEAPPLDVQGKTIGSYDYSNFIEFEKGKIDHLLKSKKVLAKVKFSTNPVSDEALYIYDDYNLDLKLGVELRIEN